MLAICSILHNEATRWLPSLLPAWEQIADFIIAVDDASTDHTAPLLQASPKVHYYLHTGLPMWGQEQPARALLWDLFCNSDADWGLWLDGDMVPANNPRSLFETPADAVAFRLYDLWQLNPHLYRHDGYWQGHLNPRLWAVRNPGPDFEPDWLHRGIHCGHLPQNVPVQRLAFAPPEMSMLHLAYSDPESRQRKYAQYAEQAGQLGRFETQHAQSIADKVTHCQPLPFPVEWDLQKYA